MLSTMLAGFSALAEEPKAKAPKAEPELGFCVGIATRCDLLPKGICYTQQGCMSPSPFNTYGGDRCLGTARACSGFARKNICNMQRGCTWAAASRGSNPRP